MRGLGALALLFFAAHAAWHVRRGTPWELFWVCNVAMVVLVVGCWSKSARLCASALMILGYGTPMWVLDLATGASMLPTSPLVHVGGLLVAAVAVRRLGWPRRTWVFACALTLLLLLVSRAVTPSAWNVNLAFRIHGGWERSFPSHVAFVASMWLGSALVFFVLERLGRKLLAPERAAQPRLVPPSGNL